MIEFSTLLQQGATNAWLFIPSAILLGALHGLEPGHSKTMMAAFIIAVRGTLTQAVLLGLSATLSHTVIVWIIALAGMYFGQQWNAEATEPYLQVVSAILIISIAVWMMWRTWREQHHAHHHHHHDDMQEIDTGHGIVRLEIFEDGVPPRFRLYQNNQDKQRNHVWTAEQLTLETVRNEKDRQTFRFVQREGFIESEQTIPEPHEFSAHLHLGHGNHAHEYVVHFTEHEHHHTESDSLDVAGDEYQDAHELAHANDIRRRFTNREVTTGQIVMFGLTGGLIPCPASITVLLLCLQLKKVALGATLVLSFSIGLALTMVMSGVLAALSIKHISKRWSGFGAFARRAPYLSGALILLVGFYLAYEGLHSLLK
ncbi:nickel/cobalt efflux protein RcnA [Undibacterium sp. FT79W]|uniref:nickel/cobalt efflux protein RcnA n=1 Tax=Undibacterium sp. FT79W TaxID=2762296 RepID=UPI00164ACCC8|nr:nickel/cobalt efflux protein RcnA [Undibacterium sp. FT79W]MBC3877307.1 nickel/cobalt efflux protein RcnA [Undibacterium sp. FT79W]